MANPDLGELLTPQHIFLDMHAEDRFSLIRRICENLNSDPVVRNAETLAEAAITREEEMSTGIENGVALPHARTNAVTHLLLAFVRPERPLDFSAPDSQPVDLVFFSAVPPRCVDEYLKLTASIVRLLQKPGVVDGLRAADTPEAVRSCLGMSG
ncbi:MAG TPA: PTS sugar transporter subunit IIA [Bacteroidetes bacterium]|nr:PTS sugar transporter subunit IIA [Bacteroidota bacterium]